MDYEENSQGDFFLEKYINNCVYVCIYRKLGTMWFCKESSKQILVEMEMQQNFRVYTSYREFVETKPEKWVP